MFEILNVVKITAVTSCAGKHMTSLSLFTLLQPFRWLTFMNVFHAVNIAIKKRQYCNTVRPQLNSGRFTQHMQTSQTWRLKKLFLNESFNFNTRDEHFYNLKLLYSGYLSQILSYKRYSFFPNILQFLFHAFILTTKLRFTTYVFFQHQNEAWKYNKSVTYSNLDSFHWSRELTCCRNCMDVDKTCCHL